MPQSFSTHVRGECLVKLDRDVMVIHTRILNSKGLQLMDQGFFVGNSYLNTINRVQRNF